MSVEKMAQSYAFRYPSKVPDCDCALCQRLGATSEQLALLEGQPSPFTEYKLVALEPITATTTSTKTKIPTYERELTDADVANLNAAQPSILPAAQTAWIKALSKIVKGLMKQKNAAPFLVPVDHIGLGLFDYPTIVRHPMDLGTVDRKLNAVPTEYVNGPNECINDIRLVFSNAFLYNKAEHWVTHAAQDLSTKFEAQLFQL